MFLKAKKSLINQYQFNWVCHVLSMIIDIPNYICKERLGSYLLWHVVLIDLYKLINFIFVQKILPS